MARGLIPSLDRAISEKIGCNLQEAAKLRDYLLEEVRKRIGDGEQVAFIKTTPNGDSELTILGLQLINDKKRK